MAETINVRDLKDEQVKALERLAELFREQIKQTGTKGAAQEEECTLAVWDSNVIGKLTREELYEDR